MSKAQDQPSRRLIKYFDKVRVRRTSKSTLFGIGRIGGHNENQYLNRGGVGDEQPHSDERTRNSPGRMAGIPTDIRAESQAVDTPAHADYGVQAETRALSTIRYFIQRLSSRQNVPRGR